MKKFTTILATAGLIGMFTGCVASSEPSIETATKLDLNKVCSVKVSGIQSVINTAKEYNVIAQKEGLEYRRLGVNNSALISSVEDAIKTGAKEVNPLDFKGKTSKTKLPTDFGAERACRFAITALTQSVEGKETWRLSVPGDGYKY
ncbi:MAG: hypothetical protein ACNI25_05915 [Halarcobacter sp.]